MCKCNVPNCNNQADYLVLLTDFYRDSEDIFVKIDVTCPFLCKQHKEENELKAIGSKKPRDVTRYPYSNQNEAQGVTKYIPLKQMKTLSKI